MSSVQSGVAESLEEAVQDALEEMFFMVVFGNAEDAEMDPGAVYARVDFAGDLAGTLSIGLSSDAAANAASNFLGQEAESLSEEQIRSVICELANIVCGSALSRWKHEGCFVLAPPEIAANSAKEAAATERKLQLDEGILSYSLAVDKPGLAG